MTNQKRGLDMSEIKKEGNKYVLDTMTLRDYFAGQALQGRTGRAYWMHPDEYAKQCYEIADAMIKERSK